MLCLRYKYLNGILANYRRITVKKICLLFCFDLICMRFTILLATNLHWGEKKTCNTGIMLENSNIMNSDETIIKGFVLSFNGDKANLIKNI